jgi:hypothetical protein
MYRFRTRFKLVLRSNNDNGLIANPPADSIIIVFIASSFPSLMCSKNEKRSNAKTSGHKRVDTPDVPDDWQDGERHGFSTRIEAANMRLHPISHDNVIGGEHFNV